MATTTCSRCGHAMERMRDPLARLRWTRYWWRGMVSFLTGPLWLCGGCGAIYTTDGELLAAGVIATDAEHKLEAYRRDMAHLRNAFGGVVVAAELVIAWLALGPESGTLAQFLAAGGAGVGALAPYGYFAGKARAAKRDLKELRRLRRVSAAGAD